MFGYLYHQIEYDYRQTVKKTIPHLKTLDDEPLIEGMGSFQKHNVFDADWAYLEELQKDICLPDENDSVSEGKLLQVIVCVKAYLLNLIIIFLLHYLYDILHCEMYILYKIDMS